jgi:hypothetical protein
MSSKPDPFLRRALFAFLFLVIAASGSAEAEDRDPAPPAEEQPTLAPGAGYRFDSKPPEDPGDEVRGRDLGPHGPAMDGVRGSGIAPAPGAFGTDASSPGDLRR